MSITMFQREVAIRPHPRSAGIGVTRHTPRLIKHARPLVLSGRSPAFDGDKVSCQCPPFRYTPYD